MKAILKSLAPQVGAMAASLSAAFATDLTKIEDAAILLGGPSVMAVVNRFRAIYKIVKR